MVHLPIHLANEAKIAGPIQYRWMYPTERYIQFLKSFIRKMACPGGSIAERYLANECMTLCSRYLDTMETKFNRLERNYYGGVIESDGGLTIFCQPGKTLKGSTPSKLDVYEMEQAHFYMLKNCDEIQPFLEEFSQNSPATSQISSDVEWSKQFISWLQEKVAGLHKHDDSKKIVLLPPKKVRMWNGVDNLLVGCKKRLQDYINTMIVRKWQICSFVTWSFAICDKFQRAH